MSATSSVAAKPNTPSLNDSNRPLSSDRRARGVSPSEATTLPPSARSIDRGNSYMSADRQRATAARSGATQQERLSSRFGGDPSVKGVRCECRHSGGRSSRSACRLSGIRKRGATVISPLAVEAFEARRRILNIDVDDTLNGYSRCSPFCNTDIWSPAACPLTTLGLTAPQGRHGAAGAIGLYLLISGLADLN